MAAKQPNKESQSKKHPDRDHIVARQEKYTTAWKSGDVKALMEFFDLDEFVYKNRANAAQAELNRSEIPNMFDRTFSDFHDLKIKTVSLHGHKHFTTWEWDISCKPALDEDGKKRPKEKCPPMHTQGCTLMWWNDNDKIIKQHEYIQVQTPS